MARPRTADGVPAIRRIAMKCGLVGPLLASGLVLLSLGAHADVLRLTASDPRQRHAGHKKRVQ